MDVDKVSFYPLLLDILTDISEAHFVAIDLELSGVPTKQIRKEAGKPSLQERYAETKEAAERYQILQIGITCVQQDIVNNKYVLQPYNFDLNPLIEERGLDIERIFSFQSGAAEFLLKVGFDIGRPFKHGVPYLSRLESREARDKHAKRQDKSAIADLQIKPTEVESLAFLQRVRDTINAWLGSQSFEALDYVNIAPANAEIFQEGQAPEELSRFEKRLTHQLVRAEFPDLVSISKHGFVQVVRLNQEREDKIAADRKRELSERINRQKGFRWIIEALLGNDVSRLDLRESAKDPVTGEHVFADMDEFRAQFNRAHGLMRDNPRMIVGHNCFLDMVYIYRTFVGPLPDTVTEFQSKLHALWPIVVDTKYMSTHNCGDINPVSSLEQIAAQLSAQKAPNVEVAAEHRKYEEVEAFHEAGFDSFLTAQIAVRLSSKLEKAGAYVDSDGVGSKVTNAITNGVSGLKLTDANLAAHGKPALTHATNGAEPAGFTPSVPGAQWKRKGDPTVPTTSGANDPYTYNPTDLKHRYTGPRDWNGEFAKEAVISGGMPGLGSDFWRVYGNKLRVFGTEEGVCKLNGEVESLGSDDGCGEGQGGVEVDCP